MGNDGLTQIGPGAGYAGTHFQYAIPSDVAPGKFITFTDGATSTSYSDVPLTIAGSTYSVTVTGVTSEGPQDLSLTSETLDDQWYSVDETLSAGERLILNGGLLVDAFNELQDGSSVLFGIKDSSWANTLDGNTSSAFSNNGFKGAMCIKLQRSTSGGGTFNVMRDGAVVGATVIYVISMLNDYSAFIEITGSGNNIRMGVAHSSQNDPINDVYTNWNSAKAQTGEQGYGITSIDVMAFYDRAGSSVVFDYANIDWTLLSEVAVPTLVSNDTSWTKGIKFSGGNEHLKQVTASTASNALRMNGLSQLASANSDSSKTSDHTYSRPWATAIVFQTPNNNTNQHIWNSGEGASSGSDNIYLRMSGSNGELYFGWGREGVGYNEYHIGNFGGSYNQSSGQWWGIYISHDGTRLNSSDATPANLLSAFDIRLMGTNDVSPVFSNLYNVGNDVNNWTSSGVRMDRGITGDFTIGGRSSNRSFHGRVASMIVTTLRKGVTKPTDDEIKLMLTDPIKWEDDYKDGEIARYGSSGSTFTYGPSNSNSKYATQIWLMGDGTSDSFSNGIRNHVDPIDQNYTKLQLVSMQSNDIENVTIAGLS